MLDANSAPPVVPAATQVSSSAPTGQVSAAVDCCPGAATFDRLESEPQKYFGFDDVTNLVDPAVSPAYWVPAYKSRSTPPLGPLQNPRQARDGTAWISVAKDGIATVRASFLGNPACSGNCTYEVTPSTVAAVVDPKPGNGVSELTVSGLAEGEAIVTVKCNGKVLGYLYVWCRKMLTLDAGVCSIFVSSDKYLDANVTPAPLTTRDYFFQRPTGAEIEAELNAVYRQALIQFKVRDLGEIDFDQASPDIRRRAKDLAFDGLYPVFTNWGTMSNMSGASSNRTYYLASLMELGTLIRSQLAEAPAIGIWYLSAPKQEWNPTAGIVESVIGNDCFIGSTNSERNLNAHEVGHLLGLRHPADEESGDQIPEYVSGNANGNIAVHDPKNVMGYGNDTSTLLFGQWRAAYKRADATNRAEAANEETS